MQHYINWDSGTINRGAFIRNTVSLGEKRENIEKNV